MIYCHRWIAQTYLRSTTCERSKQQRGWARSGLQQTRLRSRTAPSVAVSPNSPMTSGSGCLKRMGEACGSHRPARHSTSPSAGSSVSWPPQCKACVPPMLGRLPWCSPASLQLPCVGSFRGWGVSSGASEHCPPPLRGWRACGLSQESGRSRYSTAGLRCARDVERPDPFPRKGWACHEAGTGAEVRTRRLSRSRVEDST